MCTNGIELHPKRQLYNGLTRRYQRCKPHRTRVDRRYGRRDFVRTSHVAPSVSYAKKYVAAHGSFSGRLETDDCESPRLQSRAIRKEAHFEWIVRLMEAFNIKFVGEVEKYPELYNYNLKDYSKRNATEKAWNSVAKEMDLTVNECKEKWRNLRSTFVKNLKPKPSGSGTTKKKTYYLMDAMQFAIPFIKVAGNPTSNLPETSQTSDVLHVDNREEGEEEIIDDTSIAPTPTPSPSVTSTHSSALSQDAKLGTPTAHIATGIRGPHGQPIRKRKMIQSDAVDKAFIEYFSTKKAKLSAPHLVKDERGNREEGIKNFLLSMIPDLMQFNDGQLRTFKRKALLLIDEVVYDSGNVSSDSSMIQTCSNVVVAPSKKPVLPQVSFSNVEFGQFLSHSNQFSSSSPNRMTDHFSGCSGLEQSSPEEDPLQTSSIYHTL